MKWLCTSSGWCLSQSGFQSGYTRYHNISRRRPSLTAICRIDIFLWVPTVVWTSSINIGQTAISYSNLKIWTFQRVTFHFFSPPFVNRANSFKKPSAKYLLSWEKQQSNSVVMVILNNGTLSAFSEHRDLFTIDYPGRWVILADCRPMSRLLISRIEI